MYTPNLTPVPFKGDDPQGYAHDEWKAGVAEANAFLHTGPAWTTVEAEWKRARLLITNPDDHRVQGYVGCLAYWLDERARWEQ